MADLTFDAVIIGGGNKGLMLAMYLMKYGGMSVGIFERRAAARRSRCCSCVGVRPPVSLAAS